MKIDYEANRRWQQRSRKPLARTSSLQGSGTLSRGTMAQQGDEEKQRQEEYRPIRDAYMQAHPVCEFPNCRARSRDPHHRALRKGENLFRFLMAVCRKHHDWIGANQPEARRLGYLIDVPPREVVDEAEYSLDKYPKE